MKILRVYVDTSVIGGCFDVEFREWSNGLFKDFENGLFKPVISTITAIEIQRGAPAPVKEKYSELFDYDVEMLENSRDANELAETYLEKKIISQHFFEDALHIAIATIANVDLLVSWNFKHIVHY
ncbi:MAG: hypothetical protein JXJ04_02920, partial [Spirochaetales bacterium]|nr:hypothetical protein [Spirochaetales bacterium]